MFRFWSSEKFQRLGSKTVKKIEIWASGAEENLELLEQ